MYFHFSFFKLPTVRPKDGIFYSRNPEHVSGKRFIQVPVRKTFGDIISLHPWADRRYVSLTRKRYKYFNKRTSFRKTSSGSSNRKKSPLRYGNQFKYGKRAPFSSWAG